MTLFIATLCSEFATSGPLRFCRYFGDPQRARKVFKDGATPSRNIDYPQALWAAWIAYEERWGTVEQLEYAMMRVRKMGDDLARRNVTVSDLLDHLHLKEAFHPQPTAFSLFCI